VAALAAEVLEEWREAERLLTLLTPEDPERDLVSQAVEDMRLLYRTLGSARPGFPGTGVLLPSCISVLSRTC
jgi:hypothetical protein